MDKTIAILAVGTNRPIMETVSRLINKEENWFATIAHTVEEAFGLCLNQPFDLTLICGGLPKEEELELKANLTKLYPNMPVVEHFGGGSGLLYAEIFQAIGER